MHHAVTRLQQAMAATGHSRLTDGNGTKAVLLKEFALKLKTCTTQTEKEKLLTSIYQLYGNMIIGSLDIIDKKGVIKLTSDAGRTVYQPPGAMSSHSYGSSSSRISSGISSGYKPSYAAAPSKYFTSSQVDLPTASLYSAYHSPVYTRVTGTRYFDKHYPVRHFGSRLGKGYLGIHVRPSLYEGGYYGTSYLPDYGKDSWTAYRISDGAIDYGDDLAHLSRRRDYEVLKSVEQAMLPPPPSPKHARQKLQQLAMIARHGDVYKQALLSSRHKHGLRASSLPPSSSRLEELDSQTGYTPQSYAIRTAGRIQGDYDWPTPRVIRNVLPSGDALKVRARINAAVAAAKARANERPSVMRATSVPPRATSVQTVHTSGLVAIEPAPIVPKKAHTYGHKRVVRKSQRSGAGKPSSYQSESTFYTAPKVKVQLETVPSGRDLLTAKEKLCAREVVDLESPSATMGLRMRLAGAHALLDRQGDLLKRYSKGVDQEMAEVDSEVRRIKNSQAMRAKSVM